MADYPARNPFPAQSTASFEEDVSPAALLRWIEHSPTVQLPALRRLVALWNDYVRGFHQQPRGALACVFGDHGSGKTHAAKYAMARNAAQEREPPVQLYVKLQDTDIAATYRRLMSQVDKNELVDLSLRYLGAVAGEQMRQGVNVEAETAILTAVRHQPENLLAMFDAHVVDSGAVLQAQASELASVTGSVARQFQRALSFLDRSNLADTAYNWLCGEVVDDAAMRALGVTDQIADERMCRYGLQLLSTMVTRAGRPFVLVLDQCEKFLLADGVLVTRNAGLLQDLAEVVPRSNGMLVLLSTTIAWEAAPLDLRERFGDDAVGVPALRPAEATLVILTYLRAARVDQGDDLAPFTDDAIRQLLCSGGGNIRRLLQMGWACFQRGSPIRAPIDAELVVRVQGRRPLDPQAVVLSVEQALFAAGLPFERSRAGVEPPSFAIPTFDQPSWRVRVSDAVFFVDEAEAALDVLRAGQKDGAGVRQVLVVAGYASPDVMELLGAAVSEALVADEPDGFVAKVKVLANKIADGFRLGHTAVAELEQQRMSRTIEDLTLKLDRLHSDRRSEMSELRHELGAALERAQRYGERAQRHGGDATPSWSGRRHELEARIAEVRAERASDEVRQFLARRADTWRAFRTRMFSVAGSMALLAFIVPLVLVQVRDILTLVTIQALSVLSLALVLGVVVALLQTAVGERARRLSQPLMSRRDIEDAARRLDVPLDRLRDPDPLVRMAAAVAGSEGDEPRLLAALEVEPVAIVRQAIARRLALGKEFVVDLDLVDRRVGVGVKEFACLLDRSPARMPSLDGWVRALTTAESEQLRILAALRLVREPNFDRRWLETSRTDAAGLSGDDVVLRALGLGTDGQHNPLARAFREGVDAALLRDESEPALRRAARLVSPFDDGGLGTYDFLGVIPEVDNLYLFFEQAILARGASAAQPRS